MPKKHADQPTRTLTAGEVDFVSEVQTGDVTIITVRIAVDSENRYLGNLFAKRGGNRPLTELVEEGIVEAVQNWETSINRIITGTAAGDSNAEKKARKPKVAASSSGPTDSLLAAGVADGRSGPTDFTDTRM